MDNLLLQAMLLCATHFQRQDSILSMIHQQLLHNLGPSAEECEVGTWFLLCSLIYFHSLLMPDVLPSLLLQDPHCATQAGLQNQNKKEQSCSLSAQLSQSCVTCSLCRLVVNLAQHSPDMLPGGSLQLVKWLIFCDFWSSSKPKPEHNAGMDL